MGVRVTTLIKHDFDTANIEILAGQLAQRLDAVVVFGYYDDWHDEDYDYSSDFAQYENEPNTYYLKEKYYDAHDYYFIIKGYAGTNEKKVYTLAREEYFQSIFRPEEKPYIFYDLDELFPQNKNCDGISIYKECFSSSVSYYGRFSTFYACFMEGVENKEKQWEYLHDFRKEVSHEKNLMGIGDFALYVRDDVYDIIETAATSAWDEVVKFIYKYMDEGPIIDIDSWFLMQPGFEEISPFAFIDHFSYWPPGNPLLPTITHP